MGMEITGSKQLKKWSFHLFVKWYSFLLCMEEDSSCDGLILYYYNYLMKIWLFLKNMQVGEKNNVRWRFEVSG